MKMLLTALVATTALAAVAAPAAQAAQYGPDRREIRQDRHDLRQDRQDLRHDQRVAARHWRQGQRLDRRYGAYSEVDWRARRLPAPRRGYHWVRSGDDYVQAALVGGLIATVIAASR